MADQADAPRVRLFVEAPLAAGAPVALSAEQSHYAANVMRLGAGDRVALFNGSDGEWAAEILSVERRRCALRLVERTRAQSASPDIWLVFAPVKRARIDFIAAKATELGVAALWPVLTERTEARRVNTGRLAANAIEAAEQSGRLDVPEVKPPVDLDRCLADWPEDRLLLVCDPSAEARPIMEILNAARPEPGSWAVLTGPEGGLTRSELDGLAKLPFVSRAGLGPRTLRAETAGLAALACWQAARGDWRNGGTSPADRPGATMEA